MRIALCGDSSIPARPLRACSGCAGDYEDPDRTAWTAETEEDELQAEAPARTRFQEGLQEEKQDWAENEAGDERLNEEDVEDDEFPAKEA